jgi:hypothetical protein
MFKKLYSIVKKSPFYITTNIITKINTIYNKTCKKNYSYNNFNYDFKLINNNKYEELYNNKYKLIIRL